MSIRKSAFRWKSSSFWPAISTSFRGQKTCPNPAGWVGDALLKPATRESFQSLLGLGLTDALRAVTDAPGQYTFWDYQAGAWQKNQGLRIDHLLLSPQASDRLLDAGIDSYVRAWEKPSDHVPIWIDLDLEAA